MGGSCTKYWKNRTGLLIGGIGQAPCPKSQELDPMHRKLVPKVKSAPNAPRGLDDDLSGPHGSGFIYQEPYGIPYYNCLTPLFSGPPMVTLFEIL